MKRPAAKRAASQTVEPAPAHMGGPVRRLGPGQRRIRIGQTYGRQTDGYGVQDPRTFNRLNRYP